MTTRPDPPRDSWCGEMRADWDARARENAEAYINWPGIPTAAEEFFASGRADYERYVTPFLERMNFDAGGKTALEIGCGIGRLTRCLAQDFGRVIGLDISPEMVARAAKLDLPNASFRAVSGGDLLGVEDRSVDFVLSFAVFQHVPSKAAILNYFRETGRVLRPGGIFRLHMKGLWTLKLGSLLLEVGFSQNPRFLRAGLRHVPFVRLRHLDTWQGISVAPAEARAACRDARLAVTEIEDPWSIMMWVGGRKP